MLLRNDDWHTRVNLRDKFIGLSCDIVQVRIHSPVPGSFQFSQRPAKVKGWSSFIAIANGSFGLIVFRHS
jgi:hypothetical protein